MKTTIYRSFVFTCFISFATFFSYSIHIYILLEIFFSCLCVCALSVSICRAVTSYVLTALTPFSSEFKQNFSKIKTKSETNQPPDYGALQQQQQQRQQFGTYQSFVCSFYFVVSKWIHCCSLCNGFCFFLCLLSTFALGFVIVNSHKQKNTKNSIQLGEIWIESPIDKIDIGSPKCVCLKEKKIYKK